MATPLSQFEGKYEIVKKLKEGGMGAVYKVRHRLLDEIRVIKLIRPQLESDESIRARFLREARTAVKLRHVNIAQFYDFAIDEESNAFIVMEFIEGITLEEMLGRAGPQSIGLTLELAIQSLQALGYLHRRNIVHRDISPDNLMLSRDEDGAPLVKLIDLGIAKVLEDEAHSRSGRKQGLTGTGMFLGKVRYASPEQFHAQEGVSVDHRSDLYSFGLVLYELVTGKHPIKGTSVPSLIAGHLFHPPMSFDESDPSGRVPADLRAIVLKALSKTAETRIQTAEAFIKELERVRARYTFENDEVTAAFTPSGEIFTQRTQVGERGSTQQRLNKQFGLSTTPVPASGMELVAPSERSATISSGPGPAAGSAAPVVGPGQADRTPAAPPPISPAQLDQVDLSAEPRTGVLVYRPEVAIPEEEVQPPVQAAQRPSGPGEERAPETTRLAVPSDPGSRTSIEKATLLAGARQAVATGRWDDAREQLEALLAIDADHAEAKQLVTEVRARLGGAESERRARVRREQLGAVSTRLDDGDLGAAEDLLSEIERVYGADTESARARERLATLQRQAVENRVSGLVVEARVLLADEQPRQAIARLEAASALLPDHLEVAELLVQAREAQRRHEEEARRHRAIAEAVADVEGLLVANKLDGAEERLHAAVGEVGTCRELEALGERLADLRRQEIETAALAAMVSEARELLESGHPVEAEGQLRQVLERVPAHAEAVSMLRLARESVRQQEARVQRDREVGVQAGHLEKLVRKGDLDGAASKLALARQRLGESEVLDRVAALIDEARRQQVQDAVAKLVREAQDLEGSERLGDALRKLEEAQRLAPEDKELAELAAGMRQTATRQEADRKRDKAVGEGAAAIEALLKKGDWAGAKARLEAEVRRHGDSPRFSPLGERVVELERRERDKAVAGAVKEARGLSAAGRHQDALAALEKARSMAPEDPGVTEAVQEVEAARRRQEEAAARAAQEEITHKQRALPEGKPPVDGTRRMVAEGIAPRPLEPKPTPPPQPEPEKPVKPRPAVAPPRPEVRPEVKPPARPEPRPAAGPEVRPPAKKPLGLWLGIAAGVLCIAVAGYFLTHRAPVGPEPTPVPTVAAATPAVARTPQQGPTPAPLPVQAGTLVLNAVPWGQVTEILDSQGSRQPLPDNAVTPLVVALPPGRYSITLTNPEAPAPVKITAEVTGGATTRALAQLRKSDPDEVLKQLGW